MKIAFVIPFAFERFFQDVENLWYNAMQMEDEIISKRDTWHFNWCKAMKIIWNGGHSISSLIEWKNSQKYKHKSGIAIKRIP